MTIKGTGKPMKDEETSDCVRAANNPHPHGASNWLLDKGINYFQLRANNAIPLQFRDIEPRRIIEALTNGSCGD